jgi:hypothetical protein
MIIKKEYAILLQSVRVNMTEEEEEQLIDLHNDKIDWGIIAGQMFNHRLGGYFIKNLSEKRRSYIPKELRCTLELLVQAQRRQTNDIYKVLAPILEELDRYGVRYAGLKGIVLNSSIYAPGDRRSNDTDLLVYEEDLEKLDEILRKHGYLQTFGKKVNYKEATRREKLIQRMNYHDLVPYVKVLDKEFLTEHKIDINFQFDSKENNITKQIFDYGTVKYKNEFGQVQALPWETNLAHLCVHFHREGVNSLWTDGKRDVILYKIVDIMNAIRSCPEPSKIESWPELMNKLNLQKAAYYTMYALSQFYEDHRISKLMQGLNVKDTSFVNEIKREGKNEIEIRTKSFFESAIDLQR